MEGAAAPGSNAVVQQLGGAIAPTSLAPIPPSGTEVLTPC
jgi:hypothetical protein